VNNRASVFLNHWPLFHFQNQSVALQLGIANAQTLSSVNIDVRKMESAQWRFRGADNIGGRYTAMNFLNRV
jgi:hypothetical protein